MGPSKLSFNLKIPYAQAQAYYYGHKKEFATMHKFLEKVGLSAIANGFAATALGRKRFFKEPTYPKDILNEYRRTGSTQSRSLYEFTMSKIPDYRTYKRECMEGGCDPMIFHEWKDSGPGITPEIRQFMGESSSIFRESGNHPIQGGNADVTKHAMVRVRNKLRERGYYPDAHIILQVYDELVVQAPTRWREDVEQIVDSSMKEAGELIIKNIPVVVEGHIGPCWTK